MTRDPPLFTPDDRYIVVRGRLWRCSNPGLPDAKRQALVDELMRARRAIRDGDRSARARVQAAKVALGERGPVWWTDGTPDLNRRLAKNTPYADWFAAQTKDPGPLQAVRGLPSPPPEGRRRHPS